MVTGARLEHSDDVTQLLAAAGTGDRAALDRLMPHVYAELQALARRQMSRERPDHTLSATALAHEAYVKLAGYAQPGWQSRAHFLAIAAQAMRRILIDHAVRRGAHKRGGGQQRLSLEGLEIAGDDELGELLELDDALNRLRELDERQSRVVECRFFAGMSVEETAEALGIAPATVKRDWTAARAWLNRELAS